MSCAVLPRPFRPARPADRAGRRALGAELRAGGGARSRKRPDRGDARLSRRTGVLALRLDLPPAHRPHPVRRDQGRPSAPHEPRPARGDPARADRQGDRPAPRRVGAEIDVDRAGGDSRHPRGARSGTAARRLKRSSACRRKARRSAAKSSTAIVEAAVFPGELPDDPTPSSPATRIALPEADNDWRFVRFRPPQVSKTRPAPQIRLDRALQFLIGDRLA